METRKKIKTYRGTSNALDLKINKRKSSEKISSIIKTIRLTKNENKYILIHKINHKFSDFNEIMIYNLISKIKISF